MERANSWGRSHLGRGRQERQGAPGALTGGGPAGEAEPPSGASGAWGRGRGSSPAGGCGSLGAAASPPGLRRRLAPPPHCRCRCRCGTETWPLPAGAAAAGDPAVNSLGRGLTSPASAPRTAQQPDPGPRGPPGRLPRAPGPEAPLSALRTAHRVPGRSQHG